MRTLKRKMGERTVGRIIEVAEEVKRELTPPWHRKKGMPEGSSKCKALRWELKESGEYHEDWSVARKG